jgi:hypothetical protein
MSKPTLTFDRRTLLGTSTAIVTCAAALSFVLPEAGRADTATQAETPLPNGSGFYRFKIGDFQATVISDGFGSIPLKPIFAPNASETDFQSVLKANFIGPMSQGTSNVLVVDTGNASSSTVAGDRSLDRPSAISRNFRRTLRAPASLQTVSISWSCRTGISIISAV